MIEKINLLIKEYETVVDISDLLRFHCSKTDVLSAKRNWEKYHFFKPSPFGQYPL